LRWRQKAQFFTFFRVLERISRPISAISLCVFVINPEGTTVNMSRSTLSFAARLARPFAPTAALVGLCALMPLGQAQAAVAVSWSAPPAAGASFLEGTTINLFGSANSSGIKGGTGLDLALVLDSSGSMTTVNSGKTRQVWVREAATALVNALPQNSTSVAVVDFDTSATLLKPLTALNPGKASVISSINAVNASGGTTIGTGITRATTELTGANATAGRIQVQVVISDGESSGNPALNAAAAVAAGVEAVHTVGIPGHSVTTMQAIATAGNGTYTNGTDVSALIALFSGTAGNLVGISDVDITLNDGSVIDNIALDGLGNFALPTVTLALGANVFTATAHDTLGNTAVETLTLYGTPAVPEPESIALLVAGLGVVGMLSARRRRQA
jgi:Ca-activated chloride channel family protein